MSEQSDGLHLTAAYTQGVSPCAHQSGPCTYTSGRVLTSNDTTPATGFAWRIGAGESWAFQAVAKLAPQANGGDLPGGNDEGVWFSGGPPEPSWSQEFDLFEHWDYGACGASGTWPCLTGDNWVWQTNPFRVVAVVAPLEGFCQCDPSAAFHTYTAVINPDDSFGWYMDGRLIGTSPPPPSVQPVWMKMILSYALRVEQGGPDPVPAFSTPGQTRDFVVRSVSVYEDAADAGRDVQNGGVAPGTSLR